ncbi:hypothetical protein [Hymenobacter sp. AT01-02]|uniref:hypothetical protein n=1 Tax=Hymenobacter sp. AT01-02 TaxID=1571877 RepID=UPI0005F0DD08|nr:hypothetical protein [Hymenobacter sp. AT01-02]
MNSFLRQLFITGGAAVFLAACNRDSLPTAEEQLVGRWEWVESSIVSDPALTPAVTGHRIRIEFDRRGRARFFEDGTLRGAAAYSVRRAARSNAKNKYRHVIIYRGYQSSQYYLVSGNRLYLQDANGKLSNHQYIRVANSTTPVAANAQ